LITDLHLLNFRGFEDHRVPLRDRTIIVGVNNAGKSTVVEALRLVAVVTDRLLRGTSSLKKTPDWLELPVGPVGLSPSVRGLTSDGLESTLFHRYADPPAIITATFASGSQVVVYVGPNSQVHAVARRSDGAAITSPGAAAALGLTPIAAQPQVAPLLRDEPIRTDETIRRGEGTYLESQHFRNQLFRARKTKLYREFRRIAEDSWPGLQITELEGHEDRPDDPIQLRVRDGGFVGEVSLMGHGLQMWLQIVWFLARAPSSATVVLDEPDVYMHPDLQRRLLTLVRSRFAQLLIATHSIEIISDVNPRSILAVDRRLPESEFVASLPGLQQVMDNLGAVQNIQLTRLMSAESFFLVEGRDVKLLRILQSAAGLPGDPIDLIPHAEIGGRGGWRSGVAEQLPTKNGDGQKIRSFAILDGDYFPPEEHEERYAEARGWDVQLRIWSRKEIENFLLVPEAISRFIEQEAKDSGCTPDVVADQIDRIIDTLRRDPIEDTVAALLHARDRKGGIPKANKAAREYVANLWSARETRWAIAPGKKVLSRLSAWSQEEFGPSFGPEQIARALTPDEVNSEVIEVLSAITEGRPLRRPFQMPRSE
jgi:energy-coupling factor transporter ATP-binding protein EcfA2